MKVNWLYLTQVMYVFYMEYLYLGDTVSSIMRFQNAEELFKGKHQTQFSSILNTVSCLVVTVEADQDEISHLIEMINGLKVERKYLQLKMHSIDISLLQNKTINYNVGVYQSHTGDAFQILSTILEVLYF